MGEADPAWRTAVVEKLLKLGVSKNYQHRLTLVKFCAQLSQEVRCPRCSVPACCAGLCPHLLLAGAVTVADGGCHIFVLVPAVASRGVHGQL